MVVLVDVDNFLTKIDFILMQESIWPWMNTHFRIAENCFGCGFPTTLSNQPCHFIVSDNIKVKNLINVEFFWCQRCTFYAIYDHYCEDECENCNQSNEN